MRALVHSKPYVVELQDLPRPERRPGEVLIEIGAVGICGSDVHGYTGKTGRRIPPVVMGHEAAGTIIEADSDSSFSVGQRVTFDSTIYCGGCGFCQAGHVNLCSKRKVIGVSCGEYRQDGAMAQYVALPERILYSLPDGVEFASAALVETASVGFHAVSLLRGHPKTGLVIGTGVVGLFVVRALRLAGCETVIAVDLDEQKLAFATRYGATHTVNAGTDDVTAVLSDLAPSGVDVALEVVGIEKTIRQAIAAVCKHGQVVLVGNVTPDISVPLQKIVTSELTLMGACASAGEYNTVLEHMAAGRLDVKPLISVVAPLEDGQLWFDRLYKGEQSLVKVVLDPRK